MSSRSPGSHQKIELSHTAADTAITLDEMIEFCQQARERGIPGDAHLQVRLKGGTRIKRVTVTAEHPLTGPETP